MKRFIFSAIALMVAATACTESGIIDMPEFYGNPIVFDTYIGKTPVTKAENWDIGKLQAADAGAHIYGFRCDKVTDRQYDYVDYSSAYLDGRLIYNSTSSPAAWEYKIYSGSNWVKEDAYMPTDKDLAVVAYGLNAEPCIDQDTRTLTQFDFTVNDVVSSQKDLIVTPLTFVTETGTSTTVPLRFYHLLSRVGFKVLSTSDSETRIIISSVKLKGQFAKKGNVDLTYSIATPKTETKGTDSMINLENYRPEIVPIVDGTDSYQTEYELLTSDFVITAEECTTAAQIHNGKETDCYMMIMPGIQEDASIAITYKLGDASANTVEIKLADLATGIDYFKAGYAYEFIFKLSTAAIEFSAEVSSGWDEQTPTPVYPQS